MPKPDYLSQMLGMQPMPPKAPPAQNSQDMFYRDPYRTDDKSMDVRNLNRNVDLTGMLGYPTDPEYMQTVRESNLGRDANRMAMIGNLAAAKYAPRKK